MQAVLHYTWVFLPISEIFIYRQIKYLKNFSSIVVAREAENNDLFPWKDVYIHHSNISSPLFIPKVILGLDTFWDYCLSVIEKRDVKILHAHFGHLGYQTLNIKRRTGLPLITSFYGVDISKIAKTKRWKRKYQMLFEEGDFFLAEGNYLKKSLMDLGCPEEKIKIQRLGVELDKILFRPRLPKEGEKVIVLFCGRFSEKKGLIYALKAVREAYKAFPLLEFRIIGDGELRSDVEKFISDNNMKSYVKLLGMQPHDVLIRELHDADIFIHPSITTQDGETEGGAPTVLLEAQASGLPVLSTMHCDIPEYVVDGRSGFLVKEKDWQSLSERLVYLLKNQDQWVKMGHAGRLHVEESYDIKKEILKLEEAYEKCTSINIR